MDALSKETGASLDAAGPLLVAAAGAAAEAAEGKGDAARRALSEVEAARLEYLGLYNRYAMATAPASLLLADSRTREEGKRQLELACASQDFTGELKEIVQRAAAALGGFGGDGRRRSQTVRESLDRLRDRIAEGAALRASAPAALRSEGGECPDCDLEMVVDRSLSEARCPECHQLVQLHGTVYEEAQFHTQEGQRSKSGCFSPNRHYSVWMDRILALEPESEIGDPNDPENVAGEKVIRELRALARKKNKYLGMLSVEDVRDMLRILGHSELNRNASLLLMKLTGKGPPLLPEDKRLKGETMFSQAIQTRSNLEISRTNRNYYPYYIFKIYDLILEADDPNRLLLWYIHLQGAETLRNNDQEWRLICERLDWEWRPTDPAMVAGYPARFGSAARC